MIGRHHAALGALAGALTAQTLGGDLETITVAAALGAAAGLAPDIDHQGATAGRILPRWWHQLTPGHRGPTHSIIWALFVGIIATLAALLLGSGWAWQTGAVVTAGVLSHIAADGVTEMGCPYLWPWTRHRFALPEAVAIKTGGWAERILVTGLVGAGLLTLAGQWQLVGLVAAYLTGAAS